MGITGLIGLVEKASTPVNVSQLRGSVCVVDAHGWLHRACYACADQLYSGHHTDQYVRYCLKRLQHLIDVGIKPIVVFDGQKLPAKEVTHKNRQSLRHEMRQKVELLLADGHESKARDLMRNCIEITAEMAKNLMNALRNKAIDFVVAPYEADAQMAYLVNNGFADFVVTEDSDLLVYNCQFCLFKLDSNGNGKLVDLSLIKECLGNSFDSTKFRHMSILSGCDYLPNLPGIGLQRAKKFFKMTANTDINTLLYKVPDYLKMSKKVKITKDYINDFIKADNTFKYQLVFCPKQRKLVPLTPYEKGVKVDDLKYAGSLFNADFGQDFAFQFAIGNVDTKSLKIIDSYSFEPNLDSIWSEEWFNYKKKLTTNAIILKKSVSKRHLEEEDQSHRNGRQSNVQIRSQTCIDSQSSQYFSHKRLKVNESGFTNFDRLREDYSSKIPSNIILPNSATHNTSIPRKQIYSRNVFKVSQPSDDEKVVRSKYFTQPSQTNPILNTSPLTTKVINEPNLSQYSLNSSGNTTINSTFDDTLVSSDTDRSEISETSEEEIVWFTDIKPRSQRQSSQPNSKFSSSAKKTDIRRYLNKSQ